jgi:hypothetical protein
MYQNGKKAKNEALIKFVAPVDLKDSLQQLAKERNITIFSLLRLIASEYVKRKPAAHGHGESPSAKPLPS